IKYQISNIKYQISNIKYQQIKRVIMKSQAKLTKKTFYILTLSMVLIPYITTHANNTLQNTNTQQTNPITHNQDDSILIIDISPALCKLSKNYAKFRQCADGKNYVIRSLVFPKKKNCHSHSKLNLSPVQATRIKQFMPDKTMQTQAWQNHGACSGLNARDYFRKIIQQDEKLSLTNEFNNKNYQITQYQLRKNILNDNKQLADKELQFLCHTEQKGNIKTQLLTQIRICNDNNQCHTNPIDKDDKYANYTTKCTEPLLTIVKP
ncbi:MAG: hypothetical protein KGV51_04230, partial [Moraxellaceae bacterium]|nr:hypothetical protein [Moraxellaceae bacterium]